ncbi:Phospholipase/carboxylesterase/thioesterase [Penicillium cosmopolitanum]|uniref:Phospholipase/carboxylesterase/thioesterase n=1 Tax=Penicillium cosmopolitanum TaxID=1131564 RepID=A0A9W9SKV3_9EURO|nr:Phospholipase/carboxylesterase/thioesterase [Penicillium cosmopolitanum]KAJ5379574.1 Phospholipase/carboxylesterase/thioesterase [Penicillium cosmopolitanum]
MPRKPYPTPLVIQPLSKDHTHTIISLHGRGSNSERYGRELLESASLQSRLPTVKFVFPTASKLRSTVLKKIPINQWYDNYSLEDPGQRTDLQIEGLCETAEFIRGLIDQEAWALGEGGYKKDILWGLSQGCAAGIFTLLGGWPDMNEEKSLGAFIGLSGWLPFEQQLYEILGNDDKTTPVGDSHHEEYLNDGYMEDEDSTNDDSSSDEESDFSEAHESDLGEDSFQQPIPPQDDFDPFLNEDEDGVPYPFKPLSMSAIFLIYQWPQQTNDSQRVVNSFQIHVSYKRPCFLAMGQKIPRFPFTWARKIYRFLSNGFGMNVTWKAYEGLGHWYRVNDEIEDILIFLESHVKVPLEEAPLVRGI